MVCYKLIAPNKTNVPQRYAQRLQDFQVSKYFLAEPVTVHINILCSNLLALHSYWP